jgi:hypothetical protein
LERQKSKIFIIITSKFAITAKYFARNPFSGNARGVSNIRNSQKLTIRTNQMTTPFIPNAMPKIASTADYTSSSVRKVTVFTALITNLTGNYSTKKDGAHLAWICALATLVFVPK